MRNAIVFDVFAFDGDEYVKTRRSNEISMNFFFVILLDFITILLCLLLFHSVHHTVFSCGAQD